MSGRGDNNKNGSSGAGASNQSGQGLVGKTGKVNHGKQTGGQASQQQPKEMDQISNRSRSTKGREDKRKP